MPGAACQMAKCFAVNAGCRSPHGKMFCRQVAKSSAALPQLLPSTAARMPCAVFRRRGRPERTPHQKQRARLRSHRVLQSSGVGAAPSARRVSVGHAPGPHHGFLARSPRSPQLLPSAAAPMPCAVFRRRGRPARTPHQRRARLRSHRALQSSASRRGSPMRSAGQRRARPWPTSCCPRAVAALAAAATKRRRTDALRSLQTPGPPQAHATPTTSTPQVASGTPVFSFAARLPQARGGSASGTPLAHIILSSRGRRTRRSCYQALPPRCPAQSSDAGAAPCARHTNDGTPQVTSRKLRLIAQTANTANWARGQHVWFMVQTASPTNWKAQNKVSPSGKGACTQRQQFSKHGMNLSRSYRRGYFQHLQCPHSAKQHATRNTQHTTHKHTTHDSQHTARTHTHSTTLATRKPKRRMT